MENLSSLDDVEMAIVHADGCLVDAIKRYRDRNCCGILDAKHKVEDYKKGWDRKKRLNILKEFLSK